jgi:predicted GNAT family acetyltransferase
MDEIKLRLDENGDGAFYIMDGAIQLGEMIVSVTTKNITVYHTEVAPEAEGKGVAKKMLEAMVDYARKNKLKVIPLCPYVHAQFKRHPEDYADVWQKEQQSSHD